jgi:7-cyano-7-deazaguanine synthase
METVNILWSGGWDGTFRFLQLASNKVCIQPIYIKDTNRKGQQYEINAIRKIMDAVKKGGCLEAIINEPKFYDVDWILSNCADEGISSAFCYLREKYNIGIQYEWFALLAKKLGLKFETGVVHQYHGKVEEAIEAEGILSLIPNDFLPGRYEVLPKEKGSEVFSVFENLILPIIKLSKKDEERIATENGWLDIMKMSWFCHTPDKNGQPCGLCGPCDDAMHTGMEWRLPKKAQWRNKHRSTYLFLRRVKNKIGGK